MKKYRNLLFYYFLVLIGLCACRSEAEQKNTIKTPVVRRANLSSFPREAFNQVKILSLDTTLDTKLNQIYTHEFEENPYQEWNIAHQGWIFIDSMGKPIHNRYIETILDSSQTEELLHIFRPAPYPADSLIYVKTCTGNYRDVAIFYDIQAKTIAHVNLCFSCKQAFFTPEVEYMVNFENEDRFDELEDLFNKLKIKTNR